jgi:hypothetical protein
MTVSETLALVRKLVLQGEVLVSGHAYDRLEESALSTRDIEAGLAAAVAVEDYPDAHRGPSVLALQVDQSGRPIHVVWGLRKGTSSPAVLITAYRPDPELWSSDFRSRK